MAETSPQIRVGIGVMVLRDGKVLMSHRKGAHGAGQLAFPGGHLEYMETWEDCARRECKEETGIEISNVRFLCTSNVLRYAPKHYVHVTMIADWKSGEPQVLEPQKADDWRWYDPDALPADSMFEPTRISFEAYKTGKVYFVEAL